jgi:short-subunit dehydrogenase
VVILGVLFKDRRSTHWRKNDMNREKVALVTGVSSGIGRATAILLSERGFHVFGTTRKGTALNEPLVNVEIVQMDVRDDKSVCSCVQEVLREAKRIDALVNNAGIALVGALEETSVDEAKAVFETNFFGVFRVSQAVLPIMREQGYGRIANISSSAGFLPAPYSGIYAASKHALECYSESLDHEVRQFGIRVSLIEPGFMRTNMDQHTQRTCNSIKAYCAEGDLVVAATLKSIANGEDPAIVASMTLKSLTARSPKSRYLAGRGAKTVSIMRRFLPAGLFDKGLRKQFGIAST